jgi:hypothetical protein
MENAKAEKGNKFKSNTHLLKDIFCLLAILGAFSLSGFKRGRTMRKIVLKGYQETHNLMR